MSGLDSEFNKLDILVPYVLDDEEQIQGYIVELLSGAYDHRDQEPTDCGDAQSGEEDRDQEPPDCGSAQSGEEDQSHGTDEERYQQAMQSSSGVILSRLFKQILKHCNSIYAIYVPYYDDRYYRSSYSLYYYGKHFHQPGYCGRLFLFNGTKFEKLAQKVGNINREAPEIFSRSFIGSIVKKPIPGMEIGRTLIDPRYLYGPKMPYNIRKTYYSETLYGIRLSTYAFPYAMQDGETVTCSEITIQNLSDYYSKRYQEFHAVYPAEISQLAAISSYERNIPSTGLKYQDISRVLKEIRFAPKLYAAKYSKEHFLTILHVYLSSGIPLAMGIDSKNGLDAGHSIITVGQRKDLGAYFKKDSFYIEQYPNRRANSVFYIGVLGSRKGQYVLIDDGRPPYTLAEISAEYCAGDSEQRWKIELAYSKKPYELPDAIEREDRELSYDVSFLIAPLNREMVLDAEDAIQCFKNLLCSDSDSQGFNYAYHYSELLRILKDKYGEALLTGELLSYFDAGNSEDNPLLLRIFLCPSRSLKRHRVENLPLEVDYEWLCEYRGVHMPRYVWVCELYSLKSIRNKEPFSIGEIVLDASSAGKHSSDESRVIMVNYPGKLLVREPEENEFQFKQKLMKGKNTEHDRPYEFDWYGITPFVFRENMEKR